MKLSKIILAERAKAIKELNEGDIIKIMGARHWGRYSRYS
jgi:hypothetical protein